MLNTREIERRELRPFCGGLPLVEDRLLRPEERTELSRLAWRMIALGISSFLALALVGAVAVGTLAWASNFWAGALIVLTIFVVAMLLFLPATLFAREWFLQRGLLLFKDLRRGYVREFAGRVDAEGAADVTLKSLFPNVSPKVKNGEKLSLSILPVSRRVWRVDGGGCQCWIEALWIEVAMPPISMASAPTAGSGTHERALSLAERRELSGHLRRLWLTPALLTPLVSTWLALSVYAVFTARTFLNISIWSNLGHAGFVAFVGGWVLIQRVGEARMLRQDVRQGEVEVHWGAVSNAETFFEVLPISGRPWTAAGMPAAWRRIRTAADQERI